MRMLQSGQHDFDIIHALSTIDWRRASRFLPDSEIQARKANHDEPIVVTEQRCTAQRLSVQQRPRPTDGSSVVAMARAAGCGDDGTSKSVNEVCPITTVAGTGAGALASMLDPVKSMGWNCLPEPASAPISTLLGALLWVQTWPPDSSQPRLLATWKPPTWSSTELHRWRPTGQLRSAISNGQLIQPKLTKFGSTPARAHDASAWMSSTSTMWSYTFTSSKYIGKLQSPDVSGSPPMNKDVGVSFIEPFEMCEESRTPLMYKRVRRCMSARMTAICSHLPRRNRAFDSKDSSMARLESKPGAPRVSNWIVSLRDSRLNRIAGDAPYCLANALWAASTPLPMPFLNNGHSFAPIGPEASSIKNTQKV
mmetsp:Transcript_21540/g.61663  ORF Transcript_21540/g.61663 Transcript_21540/m.61663 type:complete len:366 (-) Transcript_21540:795-1892(-)